MTDRTNETARLPNPSPDQRVTLSEEVEGVVVRLRDGLHDVDLCRQAADLLTHLSAERDRVEGERNELMDINAANYTKAREAEAELSALKATWRPSREEIAVAVFKRAFHPEDVASSELIQKRKQEFAPTWEHAEECADAILSLSPEPSAEPDEGALIAAWWAGVRAGNDFSAPSDERALAAAKAFRAALKETNHDR